MTLHVGRIITDPADPFYRYHPLDSLVVFADVGDDLTAAKSAELSLSIDGPFAGDLSAEPDNLILRAYRAVAAKTDITPLIFTLTKNLPVASGIGGGSADAAAALRIMRGIVDLGDVDWRDIALSLGADVPVCLGSTTTHMSGIGQDLTPWADLGVVHAVLVNPGIAVSTASIFKAFDSGSPRETPRPQKHSGTLLERARDGRNDLQPPAIEAAPVIADVIHILSAQCGCDLARMSGSGATCFGLFEDAQAAALAAAAITDNHPTWWCVATTLGAP